jgi:hypothetical protein
MLLAQHHEQTWAHSSFEAATTSPDATIWWWVIKVLYGLPKSHQGLSKVAQKEVFAAPRCLSIDHFCSIRYPVTQQC